MGAATAINHEDIDVIGGYYYPGGHYGGTSGYYYWENYCPLCHHYNCLGNYVKGVNEISCYRCSADYDGCTGLDKAGGGARAELIRYQEPTPEPTPTPPPTTEIQPAKTQIDIYKELVQTKNIEIGII